MRAVLYQQLNISNPFIARELAVTKTTACQILTCQTKANKCDHSNESSQQAHSDDSLCLCCCWRGFISIQAKFKSVTTQMNAVAFTLLVKKSLLCYYCSCCSFFDIKKHSRERIEARNLNCRITLSGDEPGRGTVALKIIIDM